MEISESDASSAMTFGSDAEMPEDPVEEPIYLGRKREKFYKIIIERGEGIDKPGTIDEVVFRFCDFSENLSEKPFATLRLGKGLLPDYLEKGIVTMKKNEIADFHVPENLNNGEAIIVKAELLSFVNIHDLHANGMLIKKVLCKSGEIDRINIKDEVRVNFMIKQSDKVLYEENGFEIVVGVSCVSEGLEEILKTMKKGEVSEIEVDYDYFLKKFKFDLSSSENPVVRIEVLQVFKVTDVYVNGGFYKKILQYGTSETPYPNCLVEFEYKLEYFEKVLQGTMTAYLDECAIPSL